MQNRENRGQKTYHSAKEAGAHILPELGELELAGLTTEGLRKWHAALAKAPVRLRTAKGKEQNRGRRVQTAFSPFLKPLSISRGVKARPLQMQHGAGLSRSSPSMRRVFVI